LQKLWASSLLDILWTHPITHHHFGVISQVWFKITVFTELSIRFGCTFPQPPRLLIRR